MEAFKKMKTAKEITEDEYSSYEKDVEKSISSAIETIDKLETEKEKDVMTV